MISFDWLEKKRENCQNESHTPAVLLELMQTGGSLSQRCDQVANSPWVTTHERSDVTMKRVDQNTHCWLVTPQSRLGAKRKTKVAATIMVSVMVNNQSKVNMWGKNSILAAELRGHAAYITTHSTLCVSRRYTTTPFFQTNIFSFKINARIIHIRELTVKSKMRSSKTNPHKLHSHTAICYLYTSRAVASEACHLTFTRQGWLLQSSDCLTEVTIPVSFPVSVNTCRKKWPLQRGVR